jgi:hypothetical protein
LCAGGACQADVIANTFGPNDSYDPNQFTGVSWNVQASGSPYNIGFGAAVGFTVTNGPFALNSVTLALGYLQDTNNVAISVLADNSGAPGTLLETIVSHPADATNLYAVLTYQSSLHPILAGGGKNWLLVEPPDHNVMGTQNNSTYAWSASYDSVGPKAFRYFNFTSENWDNWQLANTLLPAFRVDGFSVPEPSALSSLLVGTLVWFGLRKRGRRGQPRLTSYWP